MRLVVFAFVIGISVFPVLGRGDEKHASAPTRWTIGEALQRWERAALAVKPVSDRERDQMNRLHGIPYTGHELAVAAQFRGRVTVAELQKQYEWTTIESTAEEIRLTGHPREMEERLFCPGFQILFRPETFLPVSVAFVDRAGAVRTPRLFLLTEFRIDSNVPESKPVQLAMGTGGEGSVRFASQVSFGDEARSGRAGTPLVAVVPTSIGDAARQSRPDKSTVRRRPIAPVGQVMIVGGAGRPLLLQPLFGLGDDFVFLLQLQLAQ